METTLNRALWRTSVLLIIVAAAYAGSPSDIVSTAASAGGFTTLTKALAETGLADALRGEGPFTVFAPADEAFAAVPPAALADRARLREVLAHHVVRGDLRALALEGRPVLRTLAGTSLRVDGVTIVRPDITCSNGVIHVIDRVLLAERAAPTARDALRDTIEIAIERGAPLFNAGQPGGCAAAYEVAARSALAFGATTLPAAHRENLEEALEVAEDDAPARAWALRRAFDRILLSIAKETAMEGLVHEPDFELLREADLPEGFPRPGPVGAVVMKEYPRYRAARAPGGMASFWTLFGHIKKNEIAMTAPVEMTMADAAGDGQLRMRDMAFLYATPALGHAGRDGAVEVVDLEPVRVLSVGLRGAITTEKLRAAREAIEARLGQGWQRAGEWRLLGYNSPMVPSDRRFHELQLPVSREISG